MNGYLLDANVLIALLWPSHTHHETTLRWFTRRRARKWATCPLTEAAFVRVVSNPAFSRDAVTPREAVELLAANTAAADHVFWSVDVSCSDAADGVGSRLVGHQQVTDAYLLTLAMKRGGVLATLDRSVTELAAPQSAAMKSIEVIATSSASPSN
jgi:toxin-antitoxin system PIN domain toxin